MECLCPTRVLSSASWSEMEEQVWRLITSRSYLVWWHLESIQPQQNRIAHCPPREPRDGISALYPRSTALGHVLLMTSCAEPVGFGGWYLGL